MIHSLDRAPHLRRLKLSATTPSVLILTGSTLHWRNGRSSRYPCCRLRTRMRNVQKLKSHPDLTKFNEGGNLPFQLRLTDFQAAMQDVYDFFYDVNALLTSKGLQRLDDMLRPAIMSGLLSDMLTGSMAKHSRTLTENRYFNGHPDLIVQGVYAGDAVKSGSDGVEIKTTRKSGGA